MVGKLDDHNAWLLNPSQELIPTFTPDIETNYVDSVLIALLEPWDFQWDSSMGTMWGNCVIDSIPYFAIRHFHYFFTFQRFRDELMNHLDAPGMIIDIRMSDGFSLVPAEQIPGVFTDQTMIAFYTKYRTGPEYDDLSSLTVYKLRCDRFHGMDSSHNIPHPKEGSKAGYLLRSVQPDMAGKMKDISFKVPPACKQCHCHRS